MDQMLKFHLQFKQEITEQKKEHINFSSSSSLFGIHYHGNSRGATKVWFTCTHANYIQQPFLLCNFSIMYVIFELRPDEAEPSNDHLSCGQSSDRDPER
jgi:hypothetical protein